MATSNYVACNSSGSLRNDDGSPDAGANGIFMRDRAFTISDITDGTSHTIALGERASRVRTNPCLAGIVYGVLGNQENADKGIAACLGCFHAKINETPQCRRSFGSFHYGGAQFLFADGSVHFLRENINHNTDEPVNGTIERLAGRNDGQAVADF